MKIRRWLIGIVVVLIPVAAHAIWDQLESTLLSRQIAALAHRGEPVNVIARRNALPSVQLRRAASLYAAAAVLAQWQDDSYMTNKDVEQPTADPRLDPVRLTAYLESSQPALQLLDGATPLPFGGFSTIAEELYRNPSPLDQLAAMSDLSADVFSVQRNAPAAADALIRSIRLQRTLPSSFSRTVSTRRLYGSLRIFLNHAAPDSDSLRHVQSALEELPDEDGILEELRQFRARLLGDYWPYPADGASWALRPRQSFRSGAAEEVGFVILRPWFTHVVRRQLEPFEEAMAVAQLPWPQKLDAQRALAQKYDVDVRRRLRNPSFLQRTFGFGIGNRSFGAFQLLSALPLGGANLAYRRTAITALALQRYRLEHDGRVPDSLNSLVPEYLASVPQDPFDGKPLKYKPTGDGYIVYSVDVDRVDDGGLLYGFGSGLTQNRPRRGDSTAGDIGIQVRLSEQRR